MADDDLFFVSRGGKIWACWLSGKPAVELGVDRDVSRAMVQFLKELQKQVAESKIARKPSSQPSAPPTEPRVPMVAEAPAPIVPKVLKARASPRHEITIFGRIFTTRGSRDVTILDLSETGCQFDAPGSLLQPENRLTIKLGPVGPVDATVRWDRGNRFGIEFKNPLYPSVLEHIREHFDLRNASPKNLADWEMKPPRR